MPNMQCIYGLHAVYATLKTNPGCVHEVYCDNKRRDQRIEKIISLVEKNKIIIKRVARSQLDSMVQQAKHQGVIAQCKIPVPYAEEALEAIIDGLQHPALLLILDGVQDPHNLGACLRCADGAGVDVVIIPRDRAATLTPSVVKIASGAAFSIPLVAVTNLSRTLKKLQQKGIWLVGADGLSTQLVYEIDLTGHIGIVMGAEGSGLRRLTKEVCDYLVKLPMQGVVDSLNVSVATGICLYEARRQRIMPKLG
ncbi:MAG: 23S rRNA (guanosine(2251)-2'-O)-methyltransferase RlmB [Gammaproteobacteria bacterium]|nr:23S rRNA (guanosine(2251)-2'-O)-methyltransferase RlmB [Gammaproteobacteria bacterium]